MIVLGIPCVAHLTCPIPTVPSISVFEIFFSKLLTLPSHFASLIIPLSKVADFPIEIVVGPEFVTGSTRMKAGTAQKLILNMISTSVMIGLGKVKGNRMVDMQLSNNKLVDRGTKMIMKEIGVDYETANSLLVKYGSVRDILDKYNE